MFCPKDVCTVSISFCLNGEELIQQAFLIKYVENEISTPHKTESKKIVTSYTSY